MLLAADVVYEIDQVEPLIVTCCALLKRMYSTTFAHVYIHYTVLILRAYTLILYLYSCCIYYCICICMYRYRFVLPLLPPP